MGFEIGSTVSHYELVARLGSGGMGVVYEAEDKHLRRKVAVKFLTEAMQDDPATLERFQREARAASALNHPGICTVYAIEQHEGRHFIAMELLEGQTLSSRIGNRPLAVNEMLDFGIQIADALESAHSRGIVHRDLKPANLIVNSRGQVKILDFGLAKIELPAGGVAAASNIETTAQPAMLTQAGTVIGTVHYMSPEQARGQLTDARTDLFSLGAILYQMATGELPFQGDTQAVIFESILNRDPRPLDQSNPGMPSPVGQILEKALEKDRNLRYQSATDLKTDLKRLQRKLDSGNHATTTLSDSISGVRDQGERSIAVLYFENLSGVKDDEYLRDGITEDIITDLSKIEGLRINPRSSVLAYRDKPVTSAQVGRQIGVAYVLEGSLRRSGDRLRITTQLVDTNAGYSVWSERYDREMKDVFAVQDDIAGKIADALRIKLSPREQKAIARKPTENPHAYDLYLRGRSYARRLTRQDLEFALQMYENATTQDPGFTLAYAAIANVCANYHAHYAQKDQSWIERARGATERAMALQPDLPEVMVARAWLLYAGGEYADTATIVRKVLAHKPDCEGAYYLLVCALYASGRYQDVATVADISIEAAGTDYNIYSPVANALGALGKDDALRSVRQRAIQAFEVHLRDVPEDARARILVSCYYAVEGREEDALREANLAMLLRPNEASVHYNAACTFCLIKRKAEALDALKKAWRAGFKNADWARRDPDLALLHDDPEFAELYPETPA